MSIVLAALSGLLCAASFPKFGLPVFAWISLTPLIVAVAIEAGAGAAVPLYRRPFVLGLVTGAVYFGGTLYWVAGVMSQYGDMSVAVSALIAVLLVAFQAIYPALFGALLGRAIRRYGVPGVWFAPCLWVATEWLRGSIFLPFPWVPIGASQASVIPVVQLASLFGVYGLSALVAVVGTAAAAVALSRKRGHWMRLGFAGALLVAVAVGGAVRVGRGTLVHTGTVVRVGLVQGNVPQDVKWNPVFKEQILRRYVDLSRQVIGAGAGLVIWPETSLPFMFETETAAAEPVRRLAAESRTPFIIGTDQLTPATATEPQRIYNAAELVGPDGRSRATYRKMLLVPFGEYVPFKRLLFFVRHLVEQVSDFSAGTEPVVFDVDTHRMTVSICYESVYPWLSRDFVARGSQLLATITNDAWFGRSSAARQHFELGAIRAVEEGRYVVRAANTGISGAVDPYGRVVAETRIFEPAAITVDVRMLDDRTIYNRLGDVVAWLSLAVAALMLLMSWRSR